MRTTLTNRNNLKLSPPMQTITTMAKPIFIYWQIFKPFCCGDFFGEIVCCPWGIFVMVVCYFSSSVPQMSCLRGSSEQSTTLLTPSPVLSDFRWNYSTLTPGSERSWKKISVKTNWEVADIYRQTVIWQTCGCEAISHIAFQAPGASVPCFMQLQLKAFCAVWTAQFSAKKLVCLLYWYLPMF